MENKTPELILLPSDQYHGLERFDPIRFYRLPVIGTMYRRRVEICLGECSGGKRVLEVGFGSGVSFLNLALTYAEIYGIDLTSDIEAVGAVFQKRNLDVKLCNGNVTQMPYEDQKFDTVLLISILEHLHPEELEPAFREIQRVLRTGGQVVYGVPVERPLNVFMFRLLGYDIREHHFSTERQVSAAAEKYFHKVRLIPMLSTPPIFGQVYEIGHFVKN